MKPSEFKSLIVERFKAGIKRPLLIEASPGVGKTQIAAQAAKELGVAFKAIHAPLMQPEDYGFPVISADKSDVRFIVSRDKFPIVGSDCPETGILLIDELSQCDNASQKTLANLLQEREIHGQQLKPEWLIVATGNRASDRAGANRLLSHLSDRVTHITMDCSLDDWCDWALANGIKTEVTSFIRFRPELLNKFDAQQDVFPTPRSWAEGVSQSLGQVTSALEFEVFKGDVGEGAAAEFTAFLKIYRELPTIEEIVRAPNKTKVPKDPATQYAVIGALSAHTTEMNFEPIMEYVDRLPKEFSVLYLRDAIRRCPKIQDTKCFIAWASSQGTKLFNWK